MPLHQVADGDNQSGLLLPFFVGLGLFYEVAGQLAVVPQTRHRPGVIQSTGCLRPTLGRWAFHRAVDVQIVSCHEEQLAPQFFLHLIRVPFLSDNGTHHADNGCCAFVAFLLVGDGLQVIHHLLDGAAVFRDDQIPTGTVVGHFNYHVVKVWKPLQLAGKQAFRLHK